MMQHQDTSNEVLKQNLVKSIKIFQRIMAGIAIVVALIAMHLIVSTIYQNNSFTHNSGVAGNFGQTVIDSVITEKAEKDSSLQKVRSTQEIKKSYSQGNTQKENCPERLAAYDTAYNYFILAAGILAVAFFLPRIQSLTFKDINLTIHDLVEKKVKEEKSKIVDSVNASVESNIGSGGKSKTVETNAELKKQMEATIKHPDDPQKDLWGGNDVSNNRRLSGSVMAIPGSQFFKVTLTVESISAEFPLSGKVEFHLHPTFANSKPVILVNKGIAKLELLAWGAFTVGAVADNGKTMLELDLASDKVSAPIPFKER